MAPGVIDGTEERVLAAAGGTETLVPGHPWQVQSVADILTT